MKVCISLAALFIFDISYTSSRNKCFRWWVEMQEKQLKKVETQQCLRYFHTYLEYLF